MATYAELKTQVTNTLNRSDLTDALKEQFIQQGLSRIQRKLRIPAMESSLVVPVADLDSEGGFALPSDFLETISVTQGDEQPLTKQDYRTFQSTNNNAGVPTKYTRVGPNIFVRPLPGAGSADITLWYYADSQSLVNDSDTNVLATVAEDLIVYAALSYAADFFLDARGEVFEGRYKQIYDDIELQASMQEMAGGENAVEPMYPVGEADSEWWDG